MVSEKFNAFAKDGPVTVENAGGPTLQDLHAASELTHKPGQPAPKV